MRLIFSLQGNKQYVALVHFKQERCSVSLRDSIGNKTINEWSFFFFFLNNHIMS